MNILTGVVADWLGRRALELGGLLGTISAAFLALPPAQQDAILQVLTGNWQNVTLGAAVYLISQVLSFRATVKDQVVIDGERVNPRRDLPANTRILVEEVATTAVQRKRQRQPNLLERLFGRRR